MSKSTVNIPHNFEPRHYQIEFLSEIEKAMSGQSDKRFFYQIWHRRSGKDKCNIADVIPRRLIQDPCLVKYIFPTQVMGRDNMWDGIGGDGFKYLNHIPEQIRIGKPNQNRMSMRISNSSAGTTTPTDSVFQVTGADNPDSLRGGNPKLMVFSEWADHNPYSWDVVEPITRENDGIVVFNTTPKGDNHARSLYEIAKSNPKWFVQLLTAQDTGVFSPKELEGIYKDILSRFISDGRSEMEAGVYFEQEYMCSFKSAVIGSYFGEGVKRAEDEGRVTSVPYDGQLLVHTAWDLGVDDSTTIWFYQQAGYEYRFIDYYENSGEGLAHYAGILNKKNYNYGRHYAPWDINITELGTGKTRIEQAQSLGISFTSVPKLAVLEGIDLARSLLSRCYFDKKKCERGLNALKNYKKDWDEKNKVFKSSPKRNWATHGCLVGNTPVLTDVGYVEIQYIKDGDMVATPRGYRKVVHSGVVKDTKRLITIETTNGAIRCTPEHKIFTDKGLVYADALTPEDNVWLGTRSPLLSEYFGYRKSVELLTKVSTRLSKALLGGYTSKAVRLRREIVPPTPVYDLTVEKDQCYIANGLLVSNSDAFRTFALSNKQSDTESSRRVVQANKAMLKRWKIG